MSDPVKKPILPPPTKRQFLDSKGNMTPEWQRWYANADIRLGGRSAYSNKQLEEIIIALTARVEALENP